MNVLQKTIQPEIALFDQAIKSDGENIPKKSKMHFVKQRKNLNQSCLVP